MGAVPSAQRRHRKLCETVLINGRDFTGEADVAGRPFLTRYTPLRDSSGKVIGMWFVGVEKNKPVI